MYMCIIYIFHNVTDKYIIKERERKRATLAGSEADIVVLHVGVLVQQVRVYVMYVRPRHLAGGAVAMMDGSCIIDCGTYMYVIFIYYYYGMLYCCTVM